MKLILALIRYFPREQSRRSNSKNSSDICTYLDSTHHAPGKYSGHSAHTTEHFPQPCEVGVLSPTPLISHPARIDQESPRGVFTSDPTCSPPVSMPPKRSLQEPFFSPYWSEDPQYTWRIPSEPGCRLSLVSFISHHLHLFSIFQDFLETPYQLVTPPPNTCILWAFSTF